MNKKWDILKVIIVCLLGSCNNQRMEQKVEIQCDLNDIRAIKDGKITVHQVTESKSELVEKPVDGIYELIIPCKSDSIFPPEIGQLINLQTLTLGGGDFKKMPTEIGELKKLRYLALINTCLEKLPKEFYKIPSLSRLAIMHNMNEFVFQKELCDEDMKLEVLITSTKIKEIPNCLKQGNKLEFVYKEAY